MRGLNSARHIFLYFWLLPGVIVFMLFRTVSGAEFESEYAFPIPSSPGSYNVLRFMHMYEDATRVLAANVVASREFQDRFKPVDRDFISLGWTESAYWFRLDIDRSECANEENSPGVRWYLVLGWPYYLDLDAYVRGGDELVRLNPLDEKRPDLKRQGLVGERFLPIQAGNQGFRSYYIRVYSDRSFFFTPKICSEDASFLFAMTDSVLMGIVFGIIAGMAVYNLFLCFYLKDISYAWYVAYHLFGLIYIVSKQANVIDIPYQGYISTISFDLGSMSTGMFARHFFEIWKRNKIINILSIIIIVILAFLAVIGPFSLGRQTHQLLSMAFGITCTIINLIAAIVSLWQVFWSARIFIFAWTATGILAASFAFSALGFLPFSYYNALNYGMALEALIMSLALAYRIKTLRIKREAADAANQAKGTFLAKVSHDIRTPLNAIIGFVGLALQLPAPSQIKNYLGKIRTASNSMLGLVNDILDFSKIEAGKLEIESKPFELHGFLQELADVAAERSLSNNNTLVFVVEREIPTNFYGDPVRLSQALGNLIANALKFTRNGHVVVRAQYKYISNKPGFDIRVAALTFTVKDNGIGIEPQKLPTLFQSFTQADSSIAINYGGSGLGLSICKGLVEAMVGRILAQSQLHMGSTFGFTVNRRINNGVKVSRLVMPLIGLQALVVSRNDISRNAMSEIMESLGFNVSEASSGAQAVRQIRTEKEPFSVVVLDEDVLGDSGATVDKIRKAGLMPQAVILVLTTLLRYESVKKGRSLDDAKIYAAKPLTPLSMYRSIMEALGQNDAVAQADDLSADEASARKAVAGTRILVVEDNEFNQEVAQLILGGAGAHVHIVENGAAAVKDLLERSPKYYDVVLMDMVMPVMGGGEAATQIRKYPSLRGVPIIAMTANAMRGDSEACLSAGMNAHVSKPIDTRELFVVLAQCIKGRAAGGTGSLGAGPSNLE